MVSEYSWGQFSSCIKVVGLGLHLFYQNILVHVGCSLIAMLPLRYYLFTLFAAAGLAGAHGCSLGVKHWCATNLGDEANGAYNIYGFHGA